MQNSSFCNICSSDRKQWRVVVVVSGEKQKKLGCCVNKHYKTSQNFLVKRGYMKNVSDLFFTLIHILETKPKWWIYKYNVFVMCGLICNSRPSLLAHSCVCKSVFANTINMAAVKDILFLKTFFLNDRISSAIVEQIYQSNFFLVRRDFTKLSIYPLQLLF